MKQHTIRLLAPFHSALQIASRKATAVAQSPQWLVGKWRLYMNYCPECKSCAPKLHHCEVCNADTKAYFAWNKEVEKTWWKRYADKHHFAA